MNGAALGAGVGLMAAGDIMLACEGAVFGMPEIDVGLAGGGAILHEMFGRSRGRRMMFTGQRVTAVELYRLGVIEACLPAGRLLPKVLAIAAEIAGKSLIGIRYAKISCNLVELMPDKVAYRFEQNFTYELAKTEDAAEAWRAKLESAHPFLRGSSEARCGPPGGEGNCRMVHENGLEPNGDGSVESCSERSGFCPGKVPWHPAPTAGIARPARPVCWLPEPGGPNGRRPSPLGGGRPRRTVL